MGSLRTMPIALNDEARAESCEMLNQILADTIMLAMMYKKHHWQVLGPTFQQLHLLFDQHYAAQQEAIDLLAERVQTLGGVAIAMPHDVAEKTSIPRPPAGVEPTPVILNRLLDAHERCIAGIRRGIDISARNGDMGTNDLLAGEILREQEKQVWFIASHVVDMPLVEDRD
ncbi:MAG: DNA starvation/stationary phase protection protein [Dehalococcoidia bacterium]|nr:DNA starvation/stationary phase protection protein [Dehalococcoidia bacterium]